LKTFEKDTTTDPILQINKVLNIKKLLSNGRKSVELEKRKLTKVHYLSLVLSKLQNQVFFKMGFVQKRTTLFIGFNGSHWK
jgi:hypothetical protein